MSSFFRILLLTVLILSGQIYHARAKETMSILVFGDSIIAGYGVTAEEAVPARLQAMLAEKHKGVTVINGGVSGDTTSGGKSRLAWTLDKYKPDLVILALGGNDVLRGISPQITKANIMAMLEILKQRGVPTVLTGVDAPSNLGPAFREALADVYSSSAKSYHVPLYPFLLTETYGKSELMQADGIHPSAKGADLIAKGLAAYLEERTISKIAT